MSLPSISSDLIIIATIVAAGLYGVLGGAGRLRNFILSTYAGIVLAETFTAVLQPMSHGLSTYDLSLMLLGAPIIVFILFHRGTHAKGSGFVNLILGLAAGALVVAAAIHVMPPSDASQLASNSFIATEIQIGALWIIGFMPLAAVLPQLLEHTKKRDHH